MAERGDSRKQEEVIGHGRRFDYTALMAPVPQLVTQAVLDSAEGAILNIFAGIPATTNHDLDLDA